MDNTIVVNPGHYKNLPMEVKDIIQVVLDAMPKDLTPYQSYCIGNILKYRLRAGHKDDTLVDINKALVYEEYLKGIPRKELEYDAHG